MLLTLLVNVSMFMRFVLPTPIPLRHPAQVCYGWTTGQVQSDGEDCTCKRLKLTVMNYRKRAGEWWVVNAPKAYNFILNHEAKISALPEEVYKKHLPCYDLLCRVVPSHAFVIPLTITNASSIFGKPKEISVKLPSAFLLTAFVKLSLR